MSFGQFGKKKGFLKRTHQSEEMSLQITSMADIFVILLVFLLKSYATGTTSITPSKGMIMPEANAAEASVEALKVEVSQEAVSVEGTAVMTLKQFAFEKSDMQGNGSSKTLSAAIERERKRQLLIAKSNPSVKVDAKILVIADSRAPYSTVKAVLASAALNGYTDFKMAVIKGN